jgi:hypothetical protein
MRGICDDGPLEDRPIEGELSEPPPEAVWIEGFGYRLAAETDYPWPESVHYSYDPELTKDASESGLTLRPEPVEDDAARSLGEEAQS